MVVFDLLCLFVFDHFFCVSRAGTREVHNKLEKNRLVHDDVNFLLLQLVLRKTALFFLV